MFASILMVLAAAASGAPRVLTPSERTIINEAVLPELESPGTLKIGLIPPAADIVCGRVNGMVFKAVIVRNGAGRIIKAQQVSVVTQDESALMRTTINGMCQNEGYNILP